MDAVDDSNSLYTSGSDRDKEQAGVESKPKELFPQDFALCDRMAFDVNIGCLMIGWHKQVMRKDYSNDASEQLTISVIWIQRLREIFVICKQIFITVLNDLHKQDLVSNETCRMISECAYYGNTEHESNIKNKSDCQRIYVQFVDYKELEVHEDFTDDAEIAEMLEGNASESGDELTNLKEYIIYTKESQNQTEIDHITDEILKPECLNLVDDTMGSRDPLLNIFREPPQQNKIMRARDELPRRATGVR